MNQVIGIHDVLHTCDMTKMYIPYQMAMVEYETKYKYISRVLKGDSE